MKTNERKLRFACPCGYKKRIPEEFAGKKLVCPKCSTVLRVHRIVREASLLVQCPYCEESQQYDQGITSCMACKKPLSIDLPHALPQALPMPQAAAPPPEPSTDTEDNEGHFTGLDTGEPTNVRLRRPKKRRSLLQTLVASVIQLAVSFILLAVAWIAVEDRLNLPKFPLFPNGLFQLEERLIPSPNNKVTTRGYESPLPSPCFKFGEATYEVAQGIATDGSGNFEPRGFVTFELQNLSRRKLDDIQIKFLLRISGEAIEHPHKLAAFAPMEQRTVQHSFEPRKYNMIDIVVTAFSAGGQTIESRTKHTIDLTFNGMDVKRIVPQTAAPKTEEPSTVDARQVGPKTDQP